MTDQSGVWAVVDFNYHDYVSRVYATEIEALRSVNEQGYSSKVVFLAYGEGIKG